MFIQKLPQPKKNCRCLAARRRRETTTHPSSRARQAAIAGHHRRRLHRPQPRSWQTVLASVSRLWQRARGRDGVSVAAEPAVDGNSDVETHGELELGALTALLEHPGGALGELKHARCRRPRPIPWCHALGWGGRALDPGCRASRRRWWGRPRERASVVSDSRLEGGGE
jgi:hypothetical protein